MRVILAAMVLAALAALAGLGFSAATPVFQAQAQECTGENCPPSTGQGGGHECEREKQEQTIS